MSVTVRREFTRGAGVGAVGVKSRMFAVTKSTSFIFFAILNLCVLTNAISISPDQVPERRSGFVSPLGVQIAQQHVFIFTIHRLDFLRRQCRLENHVESGSRHLCMKSHETFASQSLHLLYLLLQCVGALGAGTCAWLRRRVVASLSLRLRPKLQLHLPLTGPKPDFHHKYVAHDALFTGARSKFGAD